MAWKKIESQIFQFEEVEDFIEGELVGVEDGQFGNDVYRILTKDKGEFVVFGTTILQTKMEDIPLNTRIKIVYMGEKPSKVAGQNPLKLFEVYKWE